MTRIPLFDAHCDTIWLLSERGGALRKNALHVDITRAKKFSPYAQVFAVWLPPERAGWTGCRALIDLLYAQLDKNRDVITLCLNADDAKRAALEGKMSAFIAVEGAEKLDCSIENLRTAYALGVRAINLTWNFDNALAGAALDGGGGLTEAGRDFYAEMRRLGVIADMSHASGRTLWDVVEQSSGAPVIAGHSNSIALCDFPRNLTDAQFMALARTGGGAGLNLCPDFIGLGRDVEAVVEHAERFLGLGGERALFIGGDLDGIEQLPAGMRGIEDMDMIYEAMLRRNYSEDLVHDIFYNNLMRIMETAL